MCAVPRNATAVEGTPPGRLFFTSQGKTALVDSDGGQLEYLEFDVPNQATWQPGHFFPDGRRVVILSMEPRRDGPGRPFEEYYTQTPTHLWIVSIFNDEQLEEICTKERHRAVRHAGAAGGRRSPAGASGERQVGQIFSMRLDGSDPRSSPEPGEGLPYGLSLSPDGRRVAFHLASPGGYQVWTATSTARIAR